MEYHCIYCGVKITEEDKGLCKKHQTIKAQIEEKEEKKKQEVKDIQNKATQKRIDKVMSTL